METHGARPTSAIDATRSMKEQNPQKSGKSRLVDARGYDNHTIIANRTKITKIIASINPCK